MPVAAHSLDARAGLTLRAGLPARLGVLALVWMVEKSLLDLFVDSAAAQRARGLAAVTQLVNHWGMRLLVAFVASLTVLAIARGASRLRPLLAVGRDVPIRWRWLLAHVAALVALASLSHELYAQGPVRLPFAMLLALALGTASLCIGSSLLAMAPAGLWWRQVRSLGPLWLYAAGTACAAVSAWQFSQALWRPTAAVTFALVRWLLLPLLPALSVDAPNLIIGTDRFAIQVTDSCSGLEGVGFMAAFSLAWLLCCKADYRFPRALLLLPASVLLVFLLNALRIAGLFLLGRAGLPTLMWYGFHSQAGWMTFVMAACAMVYASRHLLWLHAEAASPAAAGSRPEERAQQGAPENPTAAYVMPLLVMLGAGAIAHVLRPDVDLLYALQGLAGALALWRYRHRWRAALEWRVSGWAVAVGVLIFVLWISYVRLEFASASMPQGLRALSAPLRLLWVVSRVGGAILIVPLAEELAYRGFLLRRLMSADFESVPLRAARWPALAASAVLFGIAHGSLWLPGTLAGLAYGAVAIRTDRLGDAVAAHAVTNALLAAAVLLAGQWQLWR